MRVGLSRTIFCFFYIELISSCLCNQKQSWCSCLSKKQYLWQLIPGNFSNNRGGPRARGRGGHCGNRLGNKIHCQLCARPGHGALQCYCRFDQQFQGPQVQN
ncbi:hypothetical protein ACOSQ2_022601 [Xanthoceras sorbifolium]